MCSVSCSDAKGLITLWPLLKFFSPSFSYVSVQSDVTGTETEAIVKVILSRRVHINELQSLLMELQ